MTTSRPVRPPRALIPALRRAVGKANVIEAEAHRRMFGYDASPRWATPDLVVFPTSAEQAGEIASKAEVGTLYLIHYPTGIFAKGDIAAEAPRTFQGNIIVAKDFMTIEIEKVTVTGR